ncbi:MAG TPA: OmpA family protein [Pyrinomonadaceae bacterium]|nr:OmpA family protein [Acidobacteriota bacterium]HQZ97507.1 OmpA family protein [Pyrinomonadaceae bacterium]
MKKTFAAKSVFIGLIVTFVSLVGLGQVDVGRKTTAITYPLDDTVTVQFRGTTRFPRMKGEAKVKRTSRSGTTIELSVEKMPRPFELGAGYATYVLWAISPTGQADNLGEIKRSGLFFIDSKVRVTTPLQTFALIITAEPHFMVTRPSQTIMLENLYPVGANGQRIGTSPAITYFGNSSDFFRDPRTPEIAETDYAKTPPAILQAKQAIALAKFAGAERDANVELSEAATLLQNAENAWQAGRDEDTVDIAARKSISASVRAESLAAQRKEAREKRNEETRNSAEIRAAESKYLDAQDQIAELKGELARETRNRELAERDAMNYSSQLKELRDENGRLREDLGRARVETETALAKLAATVQAAENEKKAIQEVADAAKMRAAEAAMMSSLKTFGTVEKTEQGIILTLPESLWAGTRSTAFTPQAEGKLTSLGEILSNYPNYRISIESHTDNTGAAAQIQTVTDKRSYAVAEKFATMGVEEGRIVAKGYGASVPVAPNTTPANKAKNRRIQIMLIPYTR